MADAIGPEFVHQRTNEKEELKTLNNRFARYLKRVQDLERENKILEAQLTQLKSRGPSNLAEKYEEELRRLRQMVDKLTHERAKAEMMRDNYANEAEQWHEKYEDELVSLNSHADRWSLWRPSAVQPIIRETISFLHLFLNQNFKKNPYISCFNISYWEPKKIRNAIHGRSSSWELS